MPKNIEHGFDFEGNPIARVTFDLTNDDWLKDFDAFFKTEEPDEDE